MPPTNQSLSLSARFDRNLAWWRGGSYRYLVVEVQAPEAEVPAAGTRVPLNLGLVIDASGSMSGLPLEAARRGAAMVIDRLDDNDRFSLVSFDHTATTHFAGAHLATDRQRLLTLVQSIEPGGNTDLSAGWLSGARGVAEVMETGASFRSRVVVLSDGHANAGILEPAELAHHAEQLRIRGITSSTIGIGEGYSALQIEAVASAGGGRMHRADNAGQIVEVMLGEFDESERTVAENISVTVAGPASARLRLLNAFPAKWTSEGLAVSAGSIASGRRLTLVFEVQAPSGAAGEVIELSASCAWQAPGMNPGNMASSRAWDSAVPASAQLTLARGTESDAQQRDLAVSLEVARAWQMSVVIEAVKLNRERRGPLARAYVHGQLGHFRRYCEGLPGTDVLIADLERLADRIAVEWDERSRHEVQLSSYKASRREREVRASAPASWSDAVPPARCS